MPVREAKPVLVVVKSIEGPEQCLDEQQPDRRVHRAACDGRILPPYWQIRWPCHSTLTSTCQPSGSGDTRARTRGDRTDGTRRNRKRSAAWSYNRQPFAARSENTTRPSPFSSTRKPRLAC